MDHNPGPVNAFLVLDLAGQMAELTMQGTTAASAAGHIDRAKGPLLRIRCETALPIMEGPFAKVPGASLFHNVALNDDDVVFVTHGVSLITARPVAANKRKEGGGQIPLHTVTCFPSTYSTIRAGLSKTAPRRNLRVGKELPHENLCSH